MLTHQQQRDVCMIARSFKGVPWRGQGRDYNGIDCTGLVTVSLYKAGLKFDEQDIDELIEHPTYRNIDPKMLVGKLLKYCDRLHRGAPLVAGDLVVYGIPHEAHVALILDGGNAIHSPSGKKVVESRFDPKRGNIRGCYRWRS